MWITIFVIAFMVVATYIAIKMTKKTKPYEPVKPKDIFHNTKNSDAKTNIRKQ